MFFSDAASMRQTLTLLKEGEFSEVDKQRLIRVYTDIRTLLSHISFVAFFGGLMVGVIVLVTMYLWSRTVVPVFRFDPIIALGMTAIFWILVQFFAQKIFKDYRKERRHVSKKLSALFDIPQFREDFNAIRQLDPQFGQAVRKLTGLL